jgi:hypothetical protein
MSLSRRQNADENHDIRIGNRQIFGNHINISKCNSGGN